MKLPSKFEVRKSLYNIEDVQQHASHRFSKERTLDKRDQRTLNRAYTDITHNIRSISIPVNQNPPTWTTGTGPKLFPAVEPTLKVPGDMTPSSINDPLTHEAPTFTTSNTASSDKRRVIKERYRTERQEPKNKESFVKLLTDTIRLTRESYAYLHWLNQHTDEYLVPAHKKNCEEAIQYVFQALKIVYHVLINAMAEISDTQPEAETTPAETSPAAAAPSTDPQPEPAAEKVPRTEPAPMPKKKPEPDTQASDRRQDILKRMRDRRG